MYRSDDDGGGDDEFLRVELSHDYETLLIIHGKSIPSTNIVLYCALTSFDGMDVCTMGPLVKLIDTFENR